MVARWTGAFRRQIDIVAVLQDRLLAVRQVRHHRAAGVAIAVLHVAAEDHAAFRVRRVPAGLNSARPAFVAIVIGNQKTAARGQRFQTRKPLDCFEDFARLRLKRRGQRQNPVAVRNFFLRIASVHGFHPNQRRRFVHTPLIRAWTGPHTFHRNAVGQREFGKLVELLSSPVPHFNCLRKAKYRMQVRVRPVNARDQQMLPIRRRLRAFEDARLARRRDLSRGCVQIHELGSRVVIEQIFVTRRAEHVFVSHHGTRAAGALLHVRTCRCRRIGGRIAATLGNRAH